MPDRFDAAQTATRYQGKAADLRRKAGGVSNEKLRTLFIELAAFYDTLAEHAERMERWKER